MQDLLSMEDDMITYQADDSKTGARHESKALLNESDHLWVEFRHQHIAKVPPPSGTYPLGLALLHDPGS